MTKIREIKPVTLPTLAEGLRGIAAALEDGTLKEPPYAVLVFGIADDDEMLNVIPLGRRMPGVAETVGMLTIAAGSVGFGESQAPIMIPTE